MYDIIIIGGGVAGLSAAMYAGRLNMKTLLIAYNLGGTVAMANVIENYPPLKSIPGIELAEKFKEHALSYNIDVKEEIVTEIIHKAACFDVKIKDESFKGKTIIYATGTEWKKLVVPGAKEFEGKGVHFCALCDAAFYKKKITAIIGGSDSAVKDALVLAENADKVYMLVRGEALRAEPINIKKIEENKKIELITGINVKEIKGTKFVEKIIVDKKVNGSNEIAVSGVFVAIGHQALSDLAKSIGVELNKKGEVIADREGKTNIKGFFAAGDVTDMPFKQAIIGAGQAVAAAYSAFKYVKDMEISCG